MGHIGVLPKADASGDAKIWHIMSASTGGLKGAVASHSWIASPARGRRRDLQSLRQGRLGSPIRRNNYVADAYWYSNTPESKEISGGEAQRLIPAVEAAIQSYPYAGVGDYRIYPPPESPTASSRMCCARCPISTRCYRLTRSGATTSGGRMLAIDSDGRDMHATLYGLIGIAAGQRSGFEVHFMAGRHRCRQSRLEDPGDRADRALADGSHQSDTHNAAHREGCTALDIGAEDGSEGFEFGAAEAGAGGGRGADRAVVFDQQQRSSSCQLSAMPSSVRTPASWRDAVGRSPAVISRL